MAPPCCHKLGNTSEPSGQSHQASCSLQVLLQGTHPHPHGGGTSISSLDDSERWPLVAAGRSLLSCRRRKSKKPAPWSGSRADNISLVKARALVALVVIIGSVTAAPVTRLAATTTSHWWVTLAFANRELGAVVEGTGIEQAANCELSVYTTSNGGVTWAPPLVLSRRAGCGAGGSTDDMAITADGSWFLATSQDLPHDLFQGRVHQPGFRVVSAARLAPSEPADMVCSVAAAGKSVWVVLANVCGLWSTAIVLESGDEGATWTRPKDVPLKSLDEANLVDATPPESLVAGAPGSAWLIGTALPPRKSDMVAGPLEVARTTDAGRTWHTSTLPCKTDRIGALLSAVGNDLAALCLGDPSAGYGPMEVVTSTNGGASWTERCNNGSLGSVRIVGDCPGFGYPGMIEAMPNGTLVIALGYPVGGVEVSLDGGRAWKLSLRSAATFVNLSQGAGTVWMLGIGPVSAGLRLAESANGRKWHTVSLPR